MASPWIAFIAAALVIVMGLLTKAWSTSKAKHEATKAKYEAEKAKMELELSSIVRRGPLRSFDLAHLMLTNIVFPPRRVSWFERESAA